MASFAAALLDELMGRHRDANPDENKRSLHWDDSEVCKYFLCGFCPHDLFTNTRADLGPCEKLHDDELRNGYVKSARYEKMGYEEDFVRFLQSLIADVERRIRRGQSRLTLSTSQAGMALTPQSARDDKIQMLTERINELVEQAEQLGCEGKVEEAQGVMKLCDQLRDERTQLENTKPLAMPAQKEMEVCPICGAFQIKGDALSRMEDHLSGRQHRGYAQCRQYVEEHKAKVIQEAEKEREKLAKEREDREKEIEMEREKRRQRDRDREREREREREERRRSRRSRSRSRDRRDRRRSHDRRRSRSRDRRRSRSRERRGSRERRRSSSKGHHTSSRDKDRTSHSHSNRDKDRTSSEKNRTSRDRDKSNRDKSSRDRSSLEQESQDRSRNGVPRNEDRSGEGSMERDALEDQAIEAEMAACLGNFQTNDSSRLTMGEGGDAVERDKRQRADSDRSDRH